MTKEQKLRNRQESEESEADIRGDVLEAILCHVPFIHLLPASHVSKSWNHAVSSSLRHFNKPKPWLIVHAQSSRPPYATTAHAYDPRSNLWLRIDQDPPIEYVSALRSSDSTLLYMLSLSKLSFSFDPLHLTWHHLDPPLVWRTDPIVAVVGHHVIVAGGACDFEDVFLLNNGVISWSSKKQTCIALSTMEAEFVALSAAVQESVWLKRFFDHLGVAKRAANPLLVNCDSQAAIAYTKDPKFHCKTKHIDTKYNFVKDMVAQKEVNVQYISTHRMIADPMTKPIPRDVFLGHVKSLGLRRS